MARELIKKEIDGKTYEFQQFGPKHALKILTKLSRICGEPLALAFTAMGSKDGEKPEGGLLDRKIDGKLLAAAVKALTDRLDEEEVIAIVMELTANDNVLCDGRRVVFDSHYQSGLGHMFKVLGTALEVQYGDFFGGLLGTQGSGLANTILGRRT